jgi:hypothetical protein
MQTGLVLFDHAPVMVGRDGRQTLRQQVIQGVTALHGDNVALLAEVIDRLDEQELDAVAGLGEGLKAAFALNAGGFGFHGRSE